MKYRKAFSLHIFLLSYITAAILAAENEPKTARDYSKLPANTWVLIHREDNSGGKTFARAVLADSGPGVDEDVADSAQEPFVTSKAGHTGLGLAIAGRLAGLHGGDLSLRTRPTGGAEATLFLPSKG